MAISVDIFMDIYILGKRDCHTTRDQDRRSAQVRKLRVDADLTGRLPLAVDRR